jgi:hypothetical protein
MIETCSTTRQWISASKCNTIEAVQRVPNEFGMLVHKMHLLFFRSSPLTWNFILSSAGLSIKYCVLIVISIFLLSPPLYAQSSRSLFPKFVDLTELQGAVVARICLNQVLAIPPEQQPNISPATEGEALRCMVNYSEVFSKEQLGVIRLVLEK